MSILKQLTATLFLLVIQFDIGAELKILEKKINKNEVAIYATNTDDFPYTVELFIKATNVSMDRNIQNKILVYPGTPYQEIVIIKGKKGYYTYKYDYKYFEGNQLSVKHDTDYTYAIPAGKNYKIMQGYNGKFSHAGKKAIDFELSVGSKVYAAREGIVLDVKYDSDKGCINPNCIHFANYILIYHNDGSIGAYFHLQKNGVAVSKNQKITKGQLIGYSGNTGWSSKPHLHFEVYTENNGVQESVPTKFLTPSGVKYLSQ